VPSDRLAVDIRHLHFSESEGKWDFSKPRSVDLMPNGENQHAILQLEWSQTGAELAIADAAGRLTVINASSMAVNDTTIMRPANLDREDELSQILAMFWLNIDRQVGEKMPTHVYILGCAHSLYSTLLLCMPRKIKTNGPTWLQSAARWALSGHELLLLLPGKGHLSSITSDLMAVGRLPKLIYGA
jgi:hypothetical protein